MMEHYKEMMIQVVQNPKTTLLVSGGTVTTGLTTTFGITPEDIGIIATLIGAVPSIMLSIYWGYRIVISVRKERERQDTAKKRQDSGLPTRREDES